jgi:serine phosphatase RsbU (regulator of sigma subunit)
MGALMAAPGSAATCPEIDWGVSWRALRGERECGDLHVVAPYAGGVLAAAIDGLGHGSEAAAAARVAGEILSTHAGEPVLRLIQRCHDGLRKTRGVVLSLASIDTASQTMSWAAVGNVQVILLCPNRAAPRRREVLNARGGVVGYQLPSLREAARSIAPGDTLLFATDGVSDRFSEEIPSGRTPQEIADELLRRFGKESDDALVLAVRWLGTSS